MAKQEKPFYITNPTTGELENTNDPNWFSNKKKFLSDKTNKYADKIVDNNYAKNKHKTPFTHVAENARNILGFKYNPTTKTFINDNGKTLPREEALEINKTLDKNFKDQKTDDYVKLAKLPIIERNIKNGVHYSGSREHLYDNPTVKKYADFKENKKREIEDKEWRKGFDAQYSDQAIRNHVRGKENKNRIAGKAPYENFSGNDLIVAENAKDIAREKLKTLQTPIKLNKDAEQISKDISLLEKAREESEWLNNLKNNYNKIIKQTEDDATYTGLGSILNLDRMKNDGK